MNLRRWFADTVANITFWGSIWTTIYIVWGLSFQQILAVGSTGLLLCALLGGVYGKYQDRFRKFFGC